MKKLVPQSRNKKNRNSTVYIAKTAENPVSSLQKDNESHDADDEIPEHVSVLQIKNVFENGSSSDKSTGTVRDRLHKTSASDKVTNCKVMSSISSDSHKSDTHHPNSCLEHKPKRSSHSFDQEGNIHVTLKSDAECFEKQKAFGENHNVTNSAGLMDSKSIRPGSLLLQPASNVRGPLMKPEYLRLNKYNDVKKYEISTKRTKVNVDELDKRLQDSLPANNIDEEMPVHLENTSELLDQDLDSEVIYEFEGAGITFDRSGLRTADLHEKKRKVSFSHHPVSVFEYPPEHSLMQSIPTENYDWEFWTESVNGSESGEVPGKSASFLQSSAVCGSSGKLGLYQSRILGHCTMITTNGLEATETASEKQQLNSAVSLMRASLVTCLSADETSHPWSDSSVTSDLLF